ncbi:MAG: hypothetical protein JJV97_01645 [SAR324 cluster bacterium]|nr:hypothetical protein [SAR324 cluster bacterium]
MEFVEVIKRILGVGWIALGLYIGYDRIIDSYAKITSGGLSDQIFGWILLLVLNPIIVFSLVVFGYFAVIGEYAKD